MKSKMKFSVYVVALIITIIVCVAGVTYAWFSTTISGTGASVTVSAGVLDVTFDEGTVINVGALEPIYDSAAATKASKSTFSIYHNSTSKVVACYSITMTVDSILEKYKSEYLKYELYNTTTGASVTGIKNFSSLSAGSVTTLTTSNNLALTDTHNYELRIWLSYSDTVDQTSLLTGNSETGVNLHLSVNSQAGSC